MSRNSNSRLSLRSQQKYEIATVHECDQLHKFQNIYISWISIESIEKSDLNKGRCVTAMECHIMGTVATLRHISSQNSRKLPVTP